MWWVWPERWEIYLCGRGAWLRRTGGKTGAWTGFSGEPEHALEQALRELAGVRERGWKPRLSIWLSGALARPFVFGPVDGLKTWAEALALAQGMAPPALGLDGDCAVTLETWPGHQAVRAAAMERTLTDQVQRIVMASRVELISMRPAWSQALHEHCKAGGVDQALAVMEPDAITLLGENPDGRALARTQLHLGPATSGDLAGLGRILFAAGPLRGTCRQARLKPLDAWDGRVLFDLAAPKELA